MLGLISNKKEYYYVAKWISKYDKNKYSMFRFKIVKDDNTTDGSVDNLEGNYGYATWETKTMLDFKPDDVCIFRGQKFHIKNVDGNRKASPTQERAFAHVINNGNMPITLLVRKAG